MLRVGRRGGKSSTLCRVAVAWVLYGAHVIPPGDVGVFAIVSINMREALGRLRTVSDILDTLGVRYEQSGPEIRLVGRPLAFRVYPASARSTVGFTCIGLLCDELARWRDEDTGANPATEVLRSIRPAMATQPDAPEFLSSSPWSTLDAHADAFERGDGPGQMVAHAPTWQANPTISEEQTRALEPDEPTWRREYAAEPMSSSAATVFDSSALAAAVVPGLTLPRLPEPGCSVVAGADWGFRSNASAVAVFHLRVGGVYEAADLLTWQPAPGQPLRPSEVAAQAALVLRRQRCRAAMADAHYREAMVEHLAQSGIGQLDAPTDVASTYVRARTLLANGKIRLPKHAQLLRDMAEVQQAPTAGGGLRIILPRRPGGSHADLVAALVLALWQRDGDHVEADAPDPLAHLGAETRADVTKELERIRARSAEGWPGWDGYLSED